MRIGTLFSGIGSPEQGAKRVYDDLELVFACEWDKFARESFNANYNIEQQHFHKDIADMDGTHYKDKVDILIGGSPCQDFSLAGLRKGIDGNKGVLIYEYIRIIKEVQPPIFIYENVKGMLSDKKGKTIKDFVQAFREMGYHCHYEVLNTKDYGVPQNRERIFLVGFKDTDHYYNFSFAPKINLEKRLKDVLESDVDEKYYLSDKMIEGFISHGERHKDKGTGFQWQPKDVEDIANCLRANAAICPTDNTIKIQVVGHSGTGGQRGDILGIDGINSCLSATDFKQPKQIQVKQGTKKGYDVAKEGDSINISFPSSTTRRGRVGKQVAQTLDCACNMAVVEPNIRIRKLTPRECFRLQDFPDSFKFVVSNSQLYKQAGNSISVNVMEMIFNQIEKSRNGNTNKNTLF